MPLETTFSEIIEKSKTNYMMGTNYGCTSTNEMVRCYKRVMPKFIEEIQRWDKIVIAKTIQDEDLNKDYEKLVPLELAHKYSKLQPPLELTSDGYELHNIDNSKDASNIV